MYSKSLIAALAISLTTGAAIAQEVNPGVAQLEAQAGVETGVYSQAQLIRLLEARENNDTDIEREILANPEGGNLSTDTMTTPSGTTTIVTTTEARVMVPEPEAVMVGEVIAGTDMMTLEYNGTRYEVPAAEVKAAQEAGVTPGFYDLDQLTRLREAQEDSENDEVQFILDDPQGPLAG